MTPTGKAEEVKQRAVNFVCANPCPTWEDIEALLESEASLARKECAELVCHFCAYPGEWSVAEKTENGWQHFCGERRASVVNCAAAAIYELERATRPERKERP